jgi:DNA polymerase III delta prime subunit
MAYFLKNGKSFRVSSKEAMDLHEKLPGGNYAVATDMFGNFYLESIDDFELPSKLYGNTLRHTDRIINTFKNRPQQTGVLLNGEKGSGKTLLAKNICTELAKEGVPTIVINRDWKGDGFFKLLQDIDQPTIVLFDEFEKVYDNPDQEQILTLLDGVFNSKKLYIMTVNDKWRVNSHMRNRPGRLFYMLDFKGLDQIFIREYCEDRLNETKYIDQICGLTSLFAEFNFDMLKALVEEMNRYNESPSQALEMLNAKPEYDDGAKYEVTLIDNGKEIKTDTVDPNIWRGNPLHVKGVDVGYDPDPDHDEVDYKEFRFTPDHLVNLSPQDGKFVFENKGSRLILTRVKEKSSYFDYSALLL